MPTPTSAPGPVTPLPSEFSQAGSTSSIRTRRRRSAESDHSRVLALLACQQRSQCGRDVRMAEPESCRLKPCGQRPDASEQLAGYLAKRGPQQAGRKREDRGPTDSSRQGHGELGVRHGLWGGEIERPGGAGVIKQEPDAADLVVQADPAQILTP